MNNNDIITKIKEGKLDINNKELFFSNLIKGLLLNLNNSITIRNISVPHIVLHTGSDLMYLENKGQDISIEPQEISNENYIYNIIPRCLVAPGGIDLIPDQLTNPYARGELQYEYNDVLYNLSAEFRRMPIKLSVDLEYYTDTFRDMLELVQQVVTKLAFVRNYYITYLGQAIQCSYKIPENFSTEHLMELDGQSTENKTQHLSLSIEIETNIPIYNERTIISSDNYIGYYKSNLMSENDLSVRTNLLKK